MAENALTTKIREVFESRNTLLSSSQVKGPLTSKLLPLSLTNTAAQIALFAAADARSPRQSPFKFVLSHRRVIEHLTLSVISISKVIAMYERYNALGVSHINQTFELSEFSEMDSVRLRELRYQKELLLFELDLDLKLTRGSYYANRDVASTYAGFEQAIIDPPAYSIHREAVTVRSGDPLGTGLAARSLGLFDAAVSKLHVLNMIKNVQTQKEIYDKKYDQFGVFEGLKIHLQDAAAEKYEVQRNRVAQRLLHSEKPGSPTNYSEQMDLLYKQISDELDFIKNTVLTVRAFLAVLNTRGPNAAFSTNSFQTIVDQTLKLNVASLGSQQNLIEARNLLNALSILLERARRTVYVSVPIAPLVRTRINEANPEIEFDLSGHLPEAQNATVLFNGACLVAPNSAPMGAATLHLPRSSWSFEASNDAQFSPEIRIALLQQSSAIGSLQFFGDEVANYPLRTDGGRMRLKLSGSGARNDQVLLLRVSVLDVA